MEFWKLRRPLRRGHDFSWLQKKLAIAFKILEQSIISTQVEFLYYFTSSYTFQFAADILSSINTLMKLKYV